MEQIRSEFRAGKSALVNRQLVADPRKGVLRVIQAEDTLVHVMWHERAADGTRRPAEEDNILFPEEATLTKISGQRVLVLKFTDDPSRDAFYWLQEPDAAGDDALIAHFNKAINSADADDMEEEAAGDPPTTSGFERGHSSNTPVAGAVLVQGDSMGVVPQGPAQMPLALQVPSLSQVPTVHPASVAHSSAADATQLQASQLAAMLSSAVAAGPGGSARPIDGGDLARSLLAQLQAAGMIQPRQGQSGQQRQQQAPGPSLEEVLRPDVLAPLLRDPQLLERLAPYLPEEHRDVASMAALAHSPQFQQQLATLGSALQTGQLDLSQFGLTAAGFSVTDFLTSIQQLVDSERAAASATATVTPATDQGKPDDGKQDGSGPMQQ